MYDIEISPAAEDDLGWFRRFERVLVFNAIETHLEHQPDIPSRKRKRLEPGHVSEWELRIGVIRVFYDVDFDNRVVRVARVGYKERNRLFFGAQEYRQ
jgi:mRNA-degrading endonuclease RelE of RelBE toxin-antitoxin system